MSQAETLAKESAQQALFILITNNCGFTTTIIHALIIISHYVHSLPDLEKCKKKPKLTPFSNIFTITVYYHVVCFQFFVLILLGPTAWHVGS